ncbi:Rne/Rng family ribonuclease [Nocardioides sp. Arc9.136]|uniref:Rne/Rng family ribonuclease n=1 Tax=Nocardioides sp. Arc9.136 TaxID=2996826 RepID=UPI002665428E|nr:Rne/Rng family ribonuclease [Nocardioides sp. Arc9.136]WKN49799.1 Rne/Rng family ribonuclease [Nocardioides sp. Arc9.136]
MADDDLQVAPTDTTVGTTPGAVPGDTPEGDAAPARKTAARKSAAKKAPAAKKATAAKTTAAKKTTAKRTAKKAAVAAEAELPIADAAPVEAPGDAPVDVAPEAVDAVGTEVAAEAGEAPPAKKAAAKRTAKKTTGKKASTRKTAAAKAADADAPVEQPADQAPVEQPADQAPAEPTAEPATEAARSAAVPLFQAPEPVKAPARRTRKKAVAAPAPVAEVEDEAVDGAAAGETDEAELTEVAPGEPTVEPPADADDSEDDTESGTDTDDADTESDSESDTDEDQDQDQDGEGGGNGRRRRRRGGRRRRKSGGGGNGESGEGGSEATAEDDEAPAAGRNQRGRGQGGQSGNGSGDTSGDKSGDASGQAEDETSEQGKDEPESGEGSSSRRRRRRRRSGEGGDANEGGEDSEKTVTRVRQGRTGEDQITAVSGSTRLEAKKQRRREGREAGRRRAPIVSEAEFLARREAVDRVMIIRQRDELTQIGVLEDKVLVEHYVARESQTSLIGNVYLGRVQNVLPSMEAAFIDIGKGRNAVLYAGEVNWSALGHREGQPRKIESVLSSGQSVLVQVTKDPIGHKGARLTSQVSLAGRFLVYVPDGTTSGISRKLPDTERGRLKALLKEIVPDTAGVIVRTAAEGASEDELTRDVERLKARWEDIEKKAKGSAPQLLYGEPDLTLKVVRDLFTEDFSRLVIEGQDAWDTVQGYVQHVAPDLAERLERYEPSEHDGKDVFAAHRVEEQIAKALDRKVWLPSGGSLIIDRTEAMTVIDVNTGKFTGSGGNLEETVTKNNLEAAEEVVRQLRLRDIGGIIVVDFIDMVLESNRDLVLRRLVECLGRDRTRHQVAEVTSLGLVQMTRKRIGTGLVESFSENCEHCQGRGVVIHDAPVEARKGAEDEGRGRSGRRRGGKGRGDDDQQQGSGKQNGGQHGGQHGGQDGGAKVPTPAELAAMARHDEKQADQKQADQKQADQKQADQKQADQKQADQKQADVPARVEPTADPAKQPAAEQAPEQAAGSAPEPAAEAPAVPLDQAPAEPAAPRVVTRTRRRSASRPAGQPATVTVSEPVSISEPASPEAPATAEAVEPLETTPATPVETPPPPRVVTRTRGRSATRPAGPPAGAQAGGGAAVDGAAATDGQASGQDSGQDSGQGVDDSSVEAVPVKKRSPRKR